MRTTFVSAGWPYMYEIPGLHNCIPMLFADALARYRRLKGESVVFLSGADEHGPRVEFVAEGLGRTPRDLVDEKFALTRPLLGQLGLALDLFTRTSDPRHERFVTAFLQRLLQRGAITRRLIQVPYCPTCEKYLPDRFAEGLCPRCRTPAFGNQCSNKLGCGIILDPSQLVSGSCAVCGGPFNLEEREHLHLSFGPYGAALRRHIEESYEASPEVRERGLQVLDQTEGVALSRDAAWGIPLPACARLENRTVYSWVDALLGKVSGTLMLDEEERIWRQPGAEKLFFLGADGVGFYAVLLPALLLASGDGYCLDGFRIVTNDVLIYEGGVCSKSSRNGIWLPEALALLPADYWRFVVFKAEASAAAAGRAAGTASLDFRWDAFASDANSHLGLIGLFFESVAGTIPTPNEDAPGLAEVREAMDALKPGAAFGLLIDALAKAPASERPSLAAGVLPLLSCFLPGAAVRAALLLAGRGSGAIFPELPLSGAHLRSGYSNAIALRRAGLDLNAELTDIRADALCVCPSRLAEG